MLQFYRCVLLFKAWPQINANTWRNNTSGILGLWNVSVNHLGEGEKESMRILGVELGLGEDMLKGESGEGRKGEKAKCHFPGSSQSSVCFQEE